MPDQRKLCSMCCQPMEGHGHWNACQTPERILARVRKIADVQAEDEGLWFVPTHVTEDILQRALRLLHVAIEGKSPAQCAIDALNKAPDAASKPVMLCGCGKVLENPAAYAAHCREHPDHFTQT